MANTFVKIATVTVGAGGSANMTFSSISSSYTDLKLMISGRSNVSGVYDYYKIKFNSSATGYSDRNVYGLGSSVGSETNNSTTYAFVYAIDGATATSNTFSSVDLYLPNYAGSTNKSYSIDGVTETNATVTPMALTAGLWSNTAAINAISIEPINGTAFVQYSTATLYGISKL